MCLSGVAGSAGEGGGVIAIVSLRWVPLIGPSGRDCRACVCYGGGWECCVVLMVIASVVRASFSNMNWMRQCICPPPLFIIVCTITIGEGFLPFRCCGFCCICESMVGSVPCRLSGVLIPRAWHRVWSFRYVLRSRIFVWLCLWGRWAGVCSRVVGC